MKRITKKEYKALVKKHKLIFSKQFTPKWLIDNKIVALDDFWDVVGILVDGQYPQPPMFKYRDYFNSPFYKKVKSFLMLKDCREFTFELPAGVEELPFCDMCESSMDVQIFPLLNGVAEWL